MWTTISGSLRRLPFSRSDQKWSDFGSCTSCLSRGRHGSSPDRWSDGGDSVIAQCDAVVFLTLGAEERLRRLQAREIRRRAGADFDGAVWVAFTDWARGYDDPHFTGRSRSAHEAWLAQLSQPVLRLNSSAPREELRDAVLEWIPSPDSR